MSKFFSFSHLNQKTFIQTGKQPWYKRISLGMNTLRIFLLALIVFVGLGYIVQVNINSTRGFEVTEMSKRSEEFRKMNKKLELQAASLRSIENIQRIQEARSLEKVNQIEYLDTDQPVVALNP